jgi:hypothetical protein
MEGMGQIARLATFAVAAILTLLAFFLPWFRIDLMGGLDVEMNAIPFRGSSGLEVILCDGCEPIGTGRLPGGLAWLASYVGFQFLFALVVSGVQVLRGHRSPAVTLWTCLSAIGLGLLVLGVLASFGPPRGVDVAVSSKPGIWFLLAACPLALVGHTRLFDRFDPPPLIEAAPPPAPIERLQPVEAPGRKASTFVRAADVGHAGLRVTTDAGSSRLAWKDVTRVQLITGLEPGVELTTRDAILRITRKSEVDYRFLPGATDGSAADNLRRLYEYARERNPSLRMTP